MDSEVEREARAWQVGVWDRISGVYQSEIDRRFTPVTENVVKRAALSPGNVVLDIGTGTGAVALMAAQLVAPNGQVTGIDVSPEMLKIAEERARSAAGGHISFREGRAEDIPAEDAHVDVVLASLIFMYVIDRPAAARELARVLRPGGRFVASVWAGPDRCDIVRLQQTAGSFSPPPPVPGVGPGSLADPAPFVEQLADSGIDARVETETLGFDFEDFVSAWDALASVTTAQLSEERRQEAKNAVLAAMWPDGDGPRHFLNETQFIVGERRG
ncbi:MAG: class I SAM-dependent methyltransferase [Dehalococcoidia bacterium]|nr:class I SAM-dependent methyltransferase [Dehalococcoidia bacterium]